jgi:hypothetical protein
MSLAKTLSNNTLNAIIGRLGLVEKGSPYLTLHSPMSPAPVGELRQFSGGPVQRMVYIGLSVPPIGLDSHMIFAFTAPDSPLPHFTLDSVLAGPHFAFHLDLIPRVDLGANLAYINEVFEPLTAVFDATKQIEGLTPAHLSPRQYALMSPWMLAYRANEEAFAQIDEQVNQFLNHWFAIVEAGISADTLASLNNTDFATRDQRNRAAVFNAEVDPVWNQVERLIGAEMGERLREILRG